MARIPIAKAGETYRRAARGLNAAAMRELEPELVKTVKFIQRRFFRRGGPRTKPRAGVIISRSGKLEASVQHFGPRLTNKGIVAGVQMRGPQARLLERGGTVRHPGVRGKLQVFQIGRRTIFTMSTRAHLIRVRKRAPLARGMEMRNKAHLRALAKGIGAAAKAAGFDTKVA